VPAPSGDGAHEFGRFAHKTSRFAHETSRFARETSRSAHKTSRSAHETSRFARETSRLVRETYRFAHETSRLVRETSRFARETSRSAHQTSRLVRETSRFALTPSGTRRPNRPPLPVSRFRGHSRFLSVRSHRTSGGRGLRLLQLPNLAHRERWDKPQRKAIQSSSLRLSKLCGVSPVWAGVPAFAGHGLRRGLGRDWNAEGVWQPVSLKSGPGGEAGTIGRRMGAKE
jgi:hypothetical protein